MHHDAQRPGAYFKISSAQIMENGVEFEISKRSFLALCKAPWHELAVGNGRRVLPDRSTSLAVGSFQQAWSAK
jgi:hypothetical protein